MTLPWIIGLAAVVLTAGIGAVFLVRHIVHRRIGQQGTKDVLPGPGPVARAWTRHRPGRVSSGKGITLLVPFRSDGDRRSETWAWLKEYWGFWLPAAELIEGHDENTPFCKTAAVNSAFCRSRGDIIVILDADCYIDASVILGCTAQIRRARRLHRRMWFVPYRHFYRLTDEASRMVLGSYPQSPYRFTSPPPPEHTEESSGQSSGHWYGALITIMPREAFIIAGGMDERFNGWGGEDLCADEETQILTTDGWKSYQDLSIGDLALTLNHETGMSEWQRVEGINIVPGEHEMISAESKTHSSLTTLNHRWPALSRTGERLWRTSATLRSHDRIPVAAECADLPDTAKYSDDLVELAAWMWTEGSIQGRNVDITQSHEVHPENCARITAALTRTFGPESSHFPHRGHYKAGYIPAQPRRAKSEADYTPRWKRTGDHFVLNPEAGEIVQALAPGRVPSREFLLALTRAQLELFIQVSMLGDGSASRPQRTHVPSRGSATLEQKDPAAVEAFAFALILSGRGVSISTRGTPARRTRFHYFMTVVTIHERVLRSIVPVTRRTPRGVDGTFERTTYSGDVWCPSTLNGTWLARRHGKVYFTGNSFMNALDTIYCKHHTTRNQVLHLWHPHIGTVHIERAWVGQSTPGSNNKLATRYQGAFGRLERMRALTREDGAGVLFTRRSP